MREVLVIAGASAVGKTVIVKELLSSNADFSLIRSATTRAPRGDGHDGEYLYYTKEEFEKARLSGEMIESMEYQGELYGTPKSELEECFERGKTPVLILDLQGVKALSEADGIRTCAVYVYDEISKIENRLYQRYMTPPTDGGYTKFLGRKMKNREDYAAIPEYEPRFYAFVENGGTVEECARKIHSIFSDFIRGAERSEDSLAIAARLKKMAEES